VAGRYARSGQDAFVPKIGDLAGAIRWLRSRDVKDSDIAKLLKTSPSHLRTIVARQRKKSDSNRVQSSLHEDLDSFHSLTQAPSPEIRDHLGIRPEQDSVSLDRRGWQRLSQLEEDVERLGQAMWAGVRYGRAVSQLRAVTPTVGCISHIERVRLLARLHQIMASIHLHVGRCQSAINASLLSLQASRVHYAESHQAGRRTALTQIAKTCLLISQAHLLRKEPNQAEHFLTLHCKASEANDAEIGADALRQRGAVRFQIGSFDQARRYFRQAAETFARKIDQGEESGEHKIPDIGNRQTNVLPPYNWDGKYGALELVNTMPQGTGEDGLRFSNNVVWAAATGLSTDDSRIHRDVYELLRTHGTVVQGFAHQATVFYLLQLAPELPFALRRDFAHLAMYVNVLKDL